MTVRREAAIACWWNRRSPWRTGSKAPPGTAPAPNQAAELNALPYVRIVSPGDVFLSSSRLEAHRLASAYVMDGKVDGVEGREWLPEQLGLAKGRPLDYRAMARACFKLDPVSLIHGVFFAQQKWPWQPKIARAVTSFIEASGVRPAVSGGVKKDVVINEAEAWRHREGIRYGPASPGGVHRRENHRVLHGRPRAVPVIRAVCASDCTA